MARFRAELKSDRGAVTRTGQRNLEATVNGWNVGVKVVAMPRPDGPDEFFIYATGGSNEVITPVLLMSIKEDEVEGYRHFLNR